MLLSDPYRPDVRLEKEIETLSPLDTNIIIWAWDKEDQFPLEEKIPGALVKRVKITGEYSKATVFLIFAYLRFSMFIFWQLLHEPCDLIHAHNLDTLLPAFIAAKIKNIPVIYDAHEAYPEKFALRRSKLLSWLAFGLERFLAKRVAAVITVTQPLADKFTGWGVKKVLLIPNYADAHFYNSYFPKENSRVFTIGWIGSIRSKMGLELLLEAMPEVIKANENIKVYLAGKIYGKSFKETLHTAIKPISGNVELDDWIPYQQLPLAYSRVDLAVSLMVPHRANEVALPVKILEAMACGVPVIATKVGPIQDIINEANCGLLIDYDKNQLIEAIGRLIYNKVELKNMGERARNIIKERYNWETVAAAMVPTYQKLLGLH